MKKLLVATWTLLAWAWAQFPPGPGLPGPMAPTMPPGPPSQGQVYQNPALGMSFPVPAGFEPAGEMPVQGGMAAAFLHPSGAELYAVSYPFQGDLQAFHRQNLQRLAQLDAQLQAQGFRVQRQPLSGLSMGGGRPSGSSPKSSTRGRATWTSPSTPQRAGGSTRSSSPLPPRPFPRSRGLPGPASGGSDRGRRPGSFSLPAARFPNPTWLPNTARLPCATRLALAARLPPGPGTPPPNPFPTPPGPGGGEGSPPPLVSPTPPMGQGASPPRATSPAPRPAFTPPADRVVELRYGKEVGDGKRFAVAVGGLRYRIAPQGSGRWAVTEVVEDPRGDEEATYLLDGLGLQEGEDALLPPVWHTGRREMGGLRA